MSIHRSPSGIAAGIVIVALGLAGSACESTNTYRPATASADEQALERIVTDADLNKRAFVESVNARRRHGLLHVQVNLRNREAGLTWFNPEYRGFRYRFEWFDDQGVKVYNPTAGWKHHLLKAKEFTTISATAPSPEAVDWRLSLHPWKGH
jgi:uncharacterized protein YcfL